MISTQILEGAKWVELREDILKEIPQASGAYVIRMRGGAVFGRLRGESDIVYIGCSDNLRRRIREYFHPGPTQRTNQRIHEVLGRYDFEIAWVEDSNYKALEHNLLLGYIGDHDELPPLNHQYESKVPIGLSEEIPLRDECLPKKL